MCSISGIVAGAGVSGVASMIECQRHRAPDESGIYSDDDIELGMGRLKIIDMASPGLAPYVEDGLVLSYNGEIFNYLELKTELQDKGWTFRTTSDTEVLLKAWREWGVGMFNRLNGMFAFAIYDSKTKQVWLARDIAGEKPLYYYHHDKVFVFSSEAKALATVLALEEQENEFFETFQHCFQSTLWKGVFEVPPAHYLVYDLNTRRTQLVEYWNFQPRTIKLKTAADELEELLGDAVRLRLRSDVPTGLYYSKGIDSSLISTYHDFDHKFYFDDTKNWRKDFFAQVGRVVRHLDFPVGSLSAYPLWKLAERAARKVKVVLSGEGADEIFGGYVRYLPIARERELQQKYPSYQYIFNKYYPAYLDGFAKITARNGNVELAREWLRPYFDRFDDPINAMGFADFKLVMPSLLQMGDRMAGAFGIENRCPFLDRRVIEFGFSLPPEQKIRVLDQKVILRRILRKRGLTSPLRDEKKGLSIRFNRWLGRKDWDRSSYSSLLRSEWSKAYGPVMVSRPTSRVTAASVGN
jgi:asparagine synthase (glutamine-hydrolysing)